MHWVGQIKYAEVHIPRRLLPIIKCQISAVYFLIVTVKDKIIAALSHAIINCCAQFLHLRDLQTYESLVLIILNPLTCVRLNMPSPMQPPAATLKII